jgi:hypothetical protein
MITYENGGITPYILNVSNRLKYAASFMLRRLYLWGKTTCHPSDVGWVLDQTWPLWRRGKSLPLKAPNPNSSVVSLIIILSYTNLIKGAGKIYAGR